MTSLNMKVNWLKGSADPTSLACFSNKRGASHCVGSQPQHPTKNGLVWSEQYGSFSLKQFEFNCQFLIWKKTYEDTSMPQATASADHPCKQILLSQHPGRYPENNFRSVCNLSPLYSGFNQRKPSNQFSVKLSLFSYLLGLVYWIILHKTRWVLLNTTWSIYLVEEQGPSL